MSKCAFGCLVLVILLASCRQPNPATQSSILNIDSLLDAQLHLLGDPVAVKKIKVNNSVFESDHTKLVLIRELESFRELGQLNQHIYRDGYQVIIHPDRQSNLTVKEYLTKNELPVESLRLFYLDRPGRLKRLEAEIVERDFYSESRKKYLLDFSLLGDTIKLESYQISGMQRYFWSNPEYFSVSTKIY